MALRPSVVLVSLTSALSLSSIAHAYCRSTTDDEPPNCFGPIECADGGVPLAWHTSQIDYGFNERGFPGLSLQEVRDTFAKSFQAWEDVTCDGESLGFHMQQLPGTTVLQEGDAATEPDENVITHYAAADWTEIEGHSPFAFALTSVWYNKSTGRIYSADLSINGRFDVYGDCAVDQCSLAGPVKTDLQNVVTHEAGHFLGLSHSPVEGSTMSCSATPSDTDKRTLERDDIEGICAAYPHGSLPDGEKHGGCSLGRTVGGANPVSVDLSVFGLLIGVLTRSRRRARSPATT